MQDETNPACNLIFDLTFLYFCRGSHHHRGRHRRILHLTDSIHTARWLTEDEKRFLQARLKSELVGQKQLVDKTHKKLIWKGITNTTSLACAMMFLFDNISVQGTAVFLPSVVRGIFLLPSTM